MEEKTRFRILSVTTQKPHSTGSGVYLTELVKAFRSSGCRQSVVAGIYHSDDVNFPPDVTFHPVYYTEPGACCRPGDIPFPVLGMSDVMPYPSTRYDQLTDQMAEQLEAAFIPAIREAVMELDPQVILCHHLYLLTAMVRQAFPDRQVWGVCHGSDLRQIRNCSFRRDWIRQEICELDRLFVLQSEQKEVLKSYYGAAPDKVTIIGSGYNPRIFNCGGESAPSTVPGPVRIIYAGKLSQEKGLLPFIDGLREIAEDPVMPTVSLELAGGCKDSLVSQRLASVDWEDLKPGVLAEKPFSIKYLGLLSQDQLASAFRRNEIFVLPSYYEGIPLVLMEAMACGLIPVSTDLPGLRDWLGRTIPDNNVIFAPLPPMVSPGVPDPESLEDFRVGLVRALKKGISQVERQRQTGLRRLPETKNASWQGVADRILSFQEIHTQPEG